MEGIEVYYRVVGRCSDLITVEFYLYIPLFEGDYIFSDQKF